MGFEGKLRKNLFLIPAAFSAVAVILSNRKLFNAVYFFLPKVVKDDFHKFVFQIIPIPKKYHVGGEKRLFLTGVSMALNAGYFGRDIRIRSRIGQSRHLKLNEILENYGMQNQENQHQTALLYLKWKIKSMQS